MDRVLIEALAVETVIGVYDWERTIRQRLVIDLEMATDIRPAAAGDDLTHTLDYAAISARIQTYADDSQFELVETFAERLAALLREEFGIPWLRMTVRKPGAVPEAQAVGVRIERGTLVDVSA
ncbi:dihydroneopterin aldolase [Cobetia marina]|jgi:dihydroneopterin aldolase|uniref:7,8-dihydroneopterin aldolase n=1 Tax=Cobetia marina TaxID=28258 RepID=A0ABU9GJC2_COBMA|nr:MULTISPECIES: dihydroneopterin aldolase [Cobetia]AOM00348.1 dihydroneopterin aldolase [Cobetia marina]AZV30442.1 dihydroneopterin aldolase [Cobetia sp. ICG0124]MDA5564947.1 dihydroneopterin aldolase [Cobetia sp. MMG027]MDH2292141.1 dihydroneopterin aldolase [Cobetia sp. 10Alg 146]MDN2657290.1 dihydroneopterin aldolase [Cobetia sp. 14N.309.X.WAT.E.A4]